MNFISDDLTHESEMHTHSFSIDIESVPEKFGVSCDFNMAVLVEFNPQKFLICLLNMY